MIFIIAGNGNYQKQVNFSEVCYLIFYLLFLGKNHENVKKMKVNEKSIKLAFHSASFVW